MTYFMCYQTVGHWSITVTVTQTSTLHAALILTCVVLFFWFRKRQWRHLSSKKYLFTTHHQLTWNIVFGHIEGNKKYVRWDSTFKTVSPFVLTLSNLPWKIFLKKKCSFIALKYVPFFFFFFNQFIDLLTKGSIKMSVNCEKSFFVIIHGEEEKPLNITETQMMSF